MLESIVEGMVEGILRVIDEAMLEIKDKDVNGPLS
jgi:hypothetical protein